MKLTTRMIRGSETAERESEMPHGQAFPQAFSHRRETWSIFHDPSRFSNKWCVQFPHSLIGFRTKKEAELAVEFGHNTAKFGAK